MSSENGPPQITISVVQMAKGWACIAKSESSPGHEDLTMYLNRAMGDWLRDHPQYQVRATLPIVSGGQTTCIHLWFDEP